jgi:hypothetical protein
VDGLRQHRQELRRRLDQVARVLRKNVFRNYRAFISAAREIGSLEDDLSRLSGLLDEQRRQLDAGASAWTKLSVGLASDRNAAVVSGCARFRTAGPVSILSVVRVFACGTL